MVSFIVRMKFAEEDREWVREVLRELGPASRAEAGCVNYVPHFLEGDPDAVLIYEQYKDEDAVKFHRTSEHFQKHVVGGLYQRMRERAVENLVDVA